MSKPRPRPSPLSREEARRRLGALLDRVRAEVEARRAFTCAGCDAWCCRVGRNGMLATRLEAEALVERLRTDPALAARAAVIVRRVRATARSLRGRARDAEPPTYDCPLLGEDNRCLVHGRGQPLGCITFMPLARGGCDHRVEAFEAAFGELQQIHEAWQGREDRDGRPIPVAVEAALRRARS